MDDICTAICERYCHRSVRDEDVLTDDEERLYNQVITATDDEDLATAEVAERRAIRDLPMRGTSDLATLSRLHAGRIQLARLLRDGLLTEGYEEGRGFVYRLSDAGMAAFALDVMVLEVLRSDLAATPDGIAAELGIPATKVQAILNDLKRMGMVDVATEQ